VGNLRVGDKADRNSFGRFVVQTYETGSSMTIIPGGAGAVCAGGMGADSGACAASGGRWEDRGGEGVTIRLKQIFAKAVSDSRKNAFTWETSRRTSGGSPVNGTGTQWVLGASHRWCANGGLRCQNAEF